ncbi:MAG: glycosyltransferase [Streptosporangiaceae bacterium]
MRLTVLAVGLRGDVEPVVALGSGLRRAGHRVRVVTSPDFASMADSAGLECVPVGPHATEVVQETQGRRMMSERGGIQGQACRLRQILTPVARGLARAAEGALTDTDAILFTPLAGVGDVPQRLGVPGIMLSLWPKSRTSTFPAVGFPEAPILRGPYNLATHLMLEQLSWRPFQHAGNQARAELGLPPIRWATPLGRWHAERRPVVYGFSEAVVPRPVDWGPHLHITGYWFPPATADWRPPPELERFLDQGEPPVVVTFGSMAASDPARLGRAAAGALRRAGRRGVVVGATFPAPDEDTVCHVRYAPYEWLFPRAAAVVHHGGAGTTAAALRAGVPSTPVPFFADQPFWAARLRALEAGTEPLPRRLLSTQRLAPAITRACEDPRLREGAARLGSELRAEDGVERAVAAIEEHLARSCHGAAPVGTARHPRSSQTQPAPS